MTDLDKLIAAVEAGDEAALYAALRAIASASRDKGEYWPAHDATKAFDGDLNAALRLHEALLPGWAWDTGHGSEEPFYANVYKGRKEHAASGETPARSWLLAILRALQEKGQ